MGYFVNRLLQLRNESVGMPFRVFLRSAHRIRNVVLIVLNKPHAVVCLEFLPFLDFELHRSDLLKYLGQIGRY